MNTPGNITCYNEEFARVADQLPGADLDWLCEHRHRAMAQFDSVGFPTVRNEEWKYTDLTKLAEQTFRVTTKSAPPSVSDLLAGASLREADEKETDELVFINGVYDANLSDRVDLIAGVTVQSLAETLKTAPAGLAALFDNDHNGECTALNSAFAHEGAYIELADNIDLHKPVHLLFVASEEDVNLAQFPRIVISLGKNSSAQVIETYIGNAKTCNFTNTITHIHTAPGAQLEHYKFQEETDDAFHIGRVDATLSRDSSLKSFSISLGAQLARHDLAIKLNAPGARVELLGLYMGDGRQHVDHHTRIDHLTPHTISLENYRGILDGHARGVFNGKVVVHPAAQNIDAQQSNKNLLFSDYAEVDTKPELEIYADDVTCAHGATVGQLDKDAFFYLLSRGVDRDTARGLLTYAFAGEIVEQISLAPLRQHLTQSIIGHLSDAERLRGFL